MKQTIMEREMKYLEYFETIERKEMDAQMW